MKKPHAITIHELKKVRRLSKLYLKIIVETETGHEGLTDEEQNEYQELKDYLQAVLPIDA